MAKKTKDGLTAFQALANEVAAEYLAKGYSVDRALEIGDATAGKAARMKGARRKK